MFRKSDLIICESTNIVTLTCPEIIEQSARLLFAARTLGHRVLADKDKDEKSVVLSSN